jgi:hypothetical protein
VKSDVSDQMGAHVATYPDLEIDPATKDFFERFYALSDDPNAHEAYTDSFTDNATLIMGSKSAKGRSGTDRVPNPSHRVQ